MEDLLNTSKYVERIKNIRSQDDEEKILQDVMDEATTKVQQSKKFASKRNLNGLHNVFS